MTINRYIPIVSAIWLGMVLSISFMEAPLKFQAPSVTLPIGLEIGQIIFSTLNKIEWILLISILGINTLDKSTTRLWLMIGILTLILIAQTTYFLPMLNNKAEMIINGETTPESNAHFLYVGLEIIKGLMLIVISFLPFKNNTHEPAK